MDTLFGLPAHPLLVHIPIVLGPLAALLALLMVIRPRWRAGLGWLTVGLALISAVGAQLATGAGEQLQERLRTHSALLSEHAERGDQARTALVIFFFVVAAWIGLHWWNDRNAQQHSVGAAARAVVPTWALTGLTVLTVLTGAIATVTVSRAGHSGARSSWCKETNDCPTGGGRGG